MNGYHLTTTVETTNRGRRIKVVDMRQGGKKNLVRDGGETEKECEEDDLDTA